MYKYNSSPYNRCEGRSGSSPIPLDYQNILYCPPTLMLYDLESVFEECYGSLHIDSDRYSFQRTHNNNSRQLKCISTKLYYLCNETNSTLGGIQTKNKHQTCPLTRSQRKARARALECALHKSKVYDPKDYDGNSSDQEE